MVQRSIGQFFDHNNEEQDSAFTRPTLDLYFVTKYWGFLTKDLSAEEAADLARAKEALERYEEIYSIFEYGSEINQVMTLLETRIACNNPSVPMTVYRKSRHNQPDKIFEEVELMLKTYYTLLDECAHSQAWVRKIEEDVGQNIAYMAIAFDESVRDQLVERSPLFARFVSKGMLTLPIGPGETEVLQVRTTNYLKAHRLKSYV